MTPERITNLIHEAWEKFTHAPYPDVAFYDLFEQAIITATKDKDRELEQAAYDKADLVREIENLQMYRKAAEKNVERYQKLRCWHQRVEVRYWTGEYWEPLISDKLDAMLDGLSDYRRGWY